MNKYKEMLKELRNTNSSNEKIAIIKKSYNNFPLIKKILNYAYDPFKVYGITSKHMRVQYGKKKAEDLHFEEFLKMLDEISERKFTGHEALDYINSWIELFVPEDAIEFLNILDRDIRCGVSATTINKAIKECVTVFKVPLAKKYIDTKEFKEEKLPFEITYVSRKLDGVRCVVIIEDGRARAFSRNGKEYTTLGNLLKEIEWMFEDNTMLDGEVCILNDDGSENFQSVMKEIRRKDHTIEKPLYYIFDMQPLSVFINGKTNMCDECRTYEELYDHLQSSEKLPTYEGNYVRILQQHDVVSFEELEGLFELANECDWEGLMLRNGRAKYEGKRTGNLLKWKKMSDEEFKVVGAIGGTGKYEDKLGAIIVNYDGFRVQVGSGFTDEDREIYWELFKKNQLPTEATIQFQEKTKDKDGNKSLRFPVFKCFVNSEVDEEDDDEEFGDMLLI